MMLMYNHYNIPSLKSFYLVRDNPALSRATVKKNWPRYAFESDAHVKMSHLAIHDKPHTPLCQVVTLGCLTGSELWCVGCVFGCEGVRVMVWGCDPSSVWDSNPTFTSPLLDVKPFCPTSCPSYLIHKPIRFTIEVVELRVHLDSIVGVVHIT